MPQHQLDIAACVLVADNSVVFTIDGITPPAATVCFQLSCPPTSEQLAAIADWICQLQDDAYRRGYQAGSSYWSEEVDNGFWPRDIDQNGND